MKTVKHKLLVILMAVITTMAFGQPSYKRSLTTSSLMKYPSVFPINVGVKGSIVDNSMLYSAVNTAKTRLLFSLDGGVAVEWECMRNFSMGLDVMYSSRGTRKSFKTEFLLNYLESDFAYYDYSAKLRGVEVFLPFTIYKDVHFPEDITFFRNSMSKVYLFVGPELYVPLSGHMDWERY